MIKIIEKITFVDFVKKILKVREHCHLTGKYGGRAHSNCNNQCHTESKPFYTIYIAQF